MRPFPSQMAWPVERPFYPEEVRQPDVGSSGAVGNGDHDMQQGSEE
ncbi:hypothetical protein A2U01_0105648, partial [Trifolium medium]|nr:hypothetical protein [Trifolium medium]